MRYSRRYNVALAIGLATTAVLGWLAGSFVDGRAVYATKAAGFFVVNVDVVVVAQRPKLAPHADAVRARVADALGCDPSQISVKGKTNEGVDSIGAGESIAAHAVALLVRS